MKNLIKIDPIAVKDKNDVVQALTILEKIGIVIKSEEQKKAYLADETKNVDDNYMIQESDGGFRIQSHYIGWGISLASLAKQVDAIVKKHPDLCERLKQIEKENTKLMEEIAKMNEEINKKN